MMIRASRLACALTVFFGLMAVVLAPTPSEAEGAQGDQGLQGGWAVDGTGKLVFPHSLSTQYAYMQQAGAGWVRINFRLGSCFADWESVGCNGRTALETYGQVVQDALDHNLKILGLLSNESWRGSQTSWRANNAENASGNGDNPYIDNFAQHAAGALASRFVGKVSQWQVWNEPNAWTSNPSPGVYTGGSFIYPSNFAWLLTRSYEAIKSANPTAVVVSGAIFSHDASSGADYLDSTYVMGAGQAGWQEGAFPLDAVGQDIYVNQSGTAIDAALTTALEEVRNTYVGYEGADTPKLTHVTEVGWSTASVSPAVQAQNLQTAYSVLQGTSYVARAYWFNVQDVPEAKLLFGLVDANGGTKPSLAAYQQYAAFTSPALAPLSVSLQLGYNTVKPGSRQTIRVSTNPNVSVRITVSYPNGERVVRSKTADQTGQLRWSYLQPNSRITHRSRTAMVTVLSKRGTESVSSIKRYVIAFAPLDVSVEPRVQKRGGTVRFWVHTRRLTKIRLEMHYSDPGDYVTFFGRTGKDGWWESGAYQLPQTACHPGPAHRPCTYPSGKATVIAFVLSDRRTAGSTSLRIT